MHTKEECTQKMEGRERTWEWGGEVAYTEMGGKSGQDVALCATSGAEIESLMLLLLCDINACLVAAVVAWWACPSQCAESRT